MTVRLTSRVQEPARCRGESRRRIVIRELAPDSQRTLLFDDDSLGDQRYRRWRTTAAEAVTGIGVGHADADAKIFVFSHGQRSQSPRNSPPQAPPIGSYSTRRRSTASRICRRWSVDALLHTAISSIVRKQPRHKPVCSSIRQTLMQGEATAGATYDPPGSLTLIRCSAWRTARAPLLTLVRGRESAK